MFPTGKPHVSYSEVRNWKECPYRHKLLHIDKIDLFKPSPYLDFGINVHEGCESYLNTRSIPKEKLLKNIRAAWEEHGFGEPEWYEKMPGWYKHVPVEEWCEWATNMWNDVPTFSYSGNDTNWVLPHNTATANTSTLTWGTGGTFFASRVLTPNATFLSAKWQANRTSGNDSVSLGSGSGTQKTFTFTTGAPAGTDFWVIKMVTAANSAWENFFCDSSGSNNDIASEAITIYDQDGGGF